MERTGFVQSPASRPRGKAVSWAGLWDSLGISFCVPGNRVERGASLDHSFPPSAHPVFAGNHRNGEDCSLAKAPEDGQIGPWYRGSPEVEGGNVVRPGSVSGVFRFVTDSVKCVPQLFIVPPSPGIEGFFNPCC